LTASSMKLSSINRFPRPGFPALSQYSGRTFRHRIDIAPEYVVDRAQLLLAGLPARGPVPTALAKKSERIHVRRQGGLISWSTFSLLPSNRMSTDNQDRQKTWYLLQNRFRQRTGYGDLRSSLLFRRCCIPSRHTLQSFVC